MHKGILESAYWRDLGIYISAANCSTDDEVLTKVGSGQIVEFLCVRIVWNEAQYLIRVLFYILPFLMQFR